MIDTAAGACLGAAMMFAVMATAPGASRHDASAAARLIAESRSDSVAGLRATALSVIDGDTFEARVAAFPGQEIVTRIRVAGVDAPELRGRCAAESTAAEAATRALAGLVERRPLLLSDVRGDKYFGRVVARVTVAGLGDVAALLVASGHGRAYAGGRREGWC